jgi:hypothetical protein
MVAVSVNWFYVILILVLGSINYGWGSSMVSETVWSALTLLALAASLLAISLKGLTRTQVIAAGVLMAAFWMSTLIVD